MPLRDQRARVADAVADRGEPAAQPRLARLDELRAGDDRDHGAAEDRRDDRHRERAAARDHAGVEAEAADQQRAHVDAVEQDHEGRHAGGDVARLHARALQRPRGQRDAAGAGAREQPRRGVAGERDLGARAQPDAGAPALDRDGPEQDRVADEGQRFEHECEGEPSEVAVGELGPDVGEIGQGRGDDDEAGDHHRARDHEHDHLPRGDAAKGQRAVGLVDGGHDRHPVARGVRQFGWASHPKRGVVIPRYSSMRSSFGAVHAGAGAVRGRGQCSVTTRRGSSARPWPAATNASSPATSDPS